MNLNIEIQKLNTSRRRKRLWYRIVSVMMCITVFVTTYALILPAVTMDNDSGAYCGYSAHKHSEDCYDDNNDTVCGIPEHEHDMACFLQHTELSPFNCQYAYEHTHDHTCYSSDSLICSLTEHTHSAECFDVSDKSNAHVHTKACLLEQRELICNEEHEHEESCWSVSVLLACNNQDNFADDFESDETDEISLKEENPDVVVNDDVTDNDIVDDDVVNNDGVDDDVTDKESVEVVSDLTKKSGRVLLGAPLRSGSSNFSLEWDSSLSTVYTITGNSVVATPLQNTPDANLRAKLMISENADLYNVGDVEIRLPMNVITDRDGAWADTLNIGLPEAPAVNPLIPFSYTVDSVNNEIIITNNTVINDSLSFNVFFEYLYTPSTVVDGTTGTIDASYRLRRNGVWGTPQTYQLDYTIDTEIDNIRVNKQFGSRHTMWDIGWGPAPANVNDLFFVKYYAQVFFNEQGGTQPSTFAITETPGESGTIVFWKEKYHNDVTSPSIYSGSVTYPNNTGYTASSLEALNFTLHCDIVDSNNVYDVYNFEIIVAYPKIPYAADGQTVTNAFAVTQTPLDGGTPVIHTDSASFTWRTSSFSYTTGSTLYKYGASNLGATAYETERPTNANYNKSGSIDSGALTLLENDTPTSLLYTVNSTARGYNVTVDAGQPSFDSWTHQVIDDQIYLEGELLVAGDYEIIEVYLESMSETFYEYEEDQGRWQSHSYGMINPDVHSLHYRLSGSGAWQSTPLSYNTSGWVTLPAGVQQVMFQYNGVGIASGITYKVKIKLNPTAHVKSLISGKDQAYFTNIASMIIRNSENDILNSQPLSTIGASEIRDQIIAHDQNGGYGLPANRVLYHKQQTDVLDSMYFIGSLQKRVTTAYDPTYSRTRLNYTVNPTGNTLGFSMGLPSSLAMTLKSDPVALQNYLDTVLATIGRHLDSFTYYDLLPPGMEIDSSTLTVTAAGSTNNLITNYQLVENWRGSGRTMLIAEVDTSNSYQAQIKGTYATMSGANPQLEITIPIQLKFTAYYNDYSILDYGASLHNVSALQHNGNSSINFISAYPDDPTSLSSSTMNQDEKDAFYDLNGITDTRDNTLYASVSTTLSILPASFSGFNKSVKSAMESLYSIETVTGPGEGYSYRLRYQANDNEMVRNLIIYDVLENAYGTNSHWNGSLVGIDVSQIASKGINPVIYYSTQSGLNPQNSTADADLSNTSVWTTVAPADLSDVTAIAVDARYRLNGTLYESGLGASFIVGINMRAPADASPYLDPVVYAWNNAVIHFSSKSSTGSWSSPTKELSTTTKVHIEQTFDISFKKIDDYTFDILPGVDFELRTASNSVFASGTTQSDGTLTFTGLEVSSVYTLYETSLLPYYLSAGPWTVTVDNTGAITVRDELNNTLSKDGSYWVVPNKMARIELPATGGIGAEVIVGAGIALATISIGVLLVGYLNVSKRRNQYN